MTIDGGWRFDLVIATPPPMCFALALIEIDGPEHRRAGITRSDSIKEAYCREIGLPLLRIGVGGDLSSEINKRQDEHVAAYALAIYETVVNAETDANLLPQFLDMIDSVAEHADPGIRNDLAALVSHVRASIDFFQGAITFDLSRRENDEYCERREKVEKAKKRRCTMATAKPRREEDDLYFDVIPKWGGIDGRYAPPSALPPPSSEGPFRARLIADDAVRHEFYAKLRSALCDTWLRDIEKHARERLGLDPREKIDGFELINLRLGIRTCLGDIEKLETPLREYLGEPPDGEWELDLEWVPCDDGEFLLPRPKKRGTSINVDIDYWSSTKQGYVQRVATLKRELAEADDAVSADDRELLLGQITLDWDERWKDFERWRELHSNVVNWPAPP